MKKIIFLLIIIMLVNINIVYADYIQLPPNTENREYYVIFKDQFNEFEWCIYLTNPSRIKSLISENNHTMLILWGNNNSWVTYRRNLKTNEQNFNYLETGSGNIQIPYYCNYSTIRSNFIIYSEYDSHGNIIYEPEPQKIYNYYIQDDGYYLDLDEEEEILYWVRKWECNRQVQIFYNSENNNHNIESRIIQLAQTRITGLDSAGIIQIYQNNNGMAIIFSNYALTSFSGFKYSEYARKFLRSNNIAHGLSYLYDETLNQPLYEKTEYDKGPLWYKRTNFNYDYSSSYALDDNKIVSRYKDLSSDYELKYSKLNDYIFIDATFSLFRDTGLDNKDSLFTLETSGYDYYSSLYEKYCRLYIRDVVIPYETPYPTTTPIIYTPVPSPTSTSYLLTPTPKPTSDTELDFDSDDLSNMTDGLGGIFRDDYFNDTFESLRQIEDNDIVPSFKINIKKIVSTITNNEYALSFFSNEEVEYIDFSILQEKMIFDISIIQFFRYLLSAHFVWITLFKVISIIQSPFSNND